MSVECIEVVVKANNWYVSFSVSEFIIEVIQRIPANRLVQWKRHCIKNLVNSKMFCLSECRAILLPVFCQQIKDKLNINEEVSPTIHIIRSCLCCCMLDVLCVTSACAFMFVFTRYVCLVYVL